MENAIKIIETNYSFNDFVLDNPITDGLILQRHGKPGDLGHVRTNIPHLVSQLKPISFDFGKDGFFGARDLAINIIEILLSRKKHKGKRIKFHTGSCFEKTYELYDQFRNDLLINAPKDGCVIPYARLEKWIDNQLGKDR